ncbi:MAG TPA: sigma 54-interacting transcriptional regulator [Candidatus Limnocylindrales bacterium]|nr:sigma 54-interacting transcriptional regulator [Candidatus Limnocylindrales bacterium]
MNAETCQTSEPKDNLLAWALNHTSPATGPRANGHSKNLQVPIYLWACSPEERAKALFRRAQNLDLQFEGLLVDILARFANLPVEQVDHEIEDALKRVCNALGLQWAQLWRNSANSCASFTLTHHYLQDSFPSEATPPEGPSNISPGMKPALATQTMPLGTDSQALFPWLTSHVRRGKKIVVSRIDDLPAEAAQDKAMLAQFETRSGMVIPFLVEGQVLGAVAFGMQSERFCPDWLLKRLEHVATVFAQATARKVSDEKLRASEAQLSLAADSAGAALWSLELSSGRFHTTPKAYELLELPNGSDLTFEGFLAMVHPEDRQRVRVATDQAILTRGDLSIEFRVVLSGERNYWVSTRGRCQYSSAGTPERLMGATVDITERKSAQEALANSYAEIQQLKDRLQAESEYLKTEIKVSHAHGHVIGQGKVIKRVLHDVEQAAPADCPVLISGETGTGKELIAQEIHRLSRRKSQMMVLVNCAALPSALVESELFGRERGAYTGALTSQVGRFELANGSTIFLDEVGELSLEVQAKLLRVLQQGEYQRLGSPKTHKVDVRVMAATNRDLAAEVRKGRFREDLYYRLNVFPIAIPPLRERIDDLPLLVFAFMEEFATRMGKKITKLPRKAMEILQRHTWPGNIRELRNVIEHSVILSSGDTLKLTIAGDGATREAQPVTLAEAEREHILRTLESTSWRIKGPHGAAKILDLEPSTLYSRMQKLGIPHRRQKDEMTSLS